MYTSKYQDEGMEDRTLQNQLLYLEVIGGQEDLV